MLFLLVSCAFFTFSNLFFSLQWAALNADFVVYSFLSPPRPLESQRAGAAEIMAMLIKKHGQQPF